MELQFVDVSHAEAAELAEELELALLRAGVPSSALSLKPASPEHMSVASVLWANVELVSHILGPVGYIAGFAKVVYEIAKKHDASIVITASGKTVKLVGSQLTLDLAQEALAVGQTKKRKRRSKARAKS